MPSLSQADMIEATRLTREGRLQEAMALLQGAPREAPTTESRNRSGAGAAERSVIDMEPPAAGSGGAWTATAAPAPKGADGFSPSDLPPALRGLVDRMSSLGSAGRPLSSSRIGPGGLPGAAARSAPIAPPEGARFEERVYANAAGSRPYKVYVPSVRRGEPLPLVVMLHGCTQSPDDFAAGTRMNEVAEEFGFLVAYPGQTQAANMSKCWNWFSASDQIRDQGEPSLIAGITRQVMRDFSVAEDRVFIAGLSAGGAKAAIMGATYPDLYAAVGVHSGLACGAARDMPSAFAAMKQGGGAAAADRAGPAMPTIIFHGDRDTTVHPVNGDEVAAQATAGTTQSAEVLQGQSPGGVAFSRTVRRDAAGRAILEHWVLHGAGHAWSGGSSAGSYTDPLGPDASREMARFFMAGAQATE